jgi:hypothetical protein
MAYDYSGPLWWSSLIAHRDSIQKAVKAGEGAYSNLLQKKHELEEIIKKMVKQSFDKNTINAEQDTLAGVDHQMMVHKIRQAELLATNRLIKELAPLKQTKCLDDDVEKEPAGFLGNRVDVSDMQANKHFMQGLGTGTTLDNHHTVIEQFRKQLWAPMIERMAAAVADSLLVGDGNQPQQPNPKPYEHAYIELLKKDLSGSGERLTAAERAMLNQPFACIQKGGYDDRLTSLLEKAGELADESMQYFPANSIQLYNMSAQFVQRKGSEVSDYVASVCRDINLDHLELSALVKMWVSFLAWIGYTATSDTYLQEAKDSISHMFAIGDSILETEEGKAYIEQVTKACLDYDKCDAGQDMQPLLDQQAQALLDQYHCLKVPSLDATSRHVRIKSDFLNPSISTFARRCVRLNQGNQHREDAVKFFKSAPAVSEPKHAAHQVPTITVH